MGASHGPRQDADDNEMASWIGSGMVARGAQCQKRTFGRLSGG
jgi:hypothetical protein